MAPGVKSRFFGCYWQSMFLTAMVYPEKADSIKDKEKIRHFKAYYNSFKFILPCKFCREYIKDHLEKELPLDFTGRKKLIYSLYLWKDSVNNKLISQKCKKTKKSPSFGLVLKRLEKLYAVCNPKIGQCV